MSLSNKAAQQAVKDELAAKDARIEQLEQQLKDARKANHTLPAGKKRKSSKTDFIRLIVPDTHGCHIDKKWAAALFGDIGQLDIKQVVHLGDALECGSFLAQHHTLGYVSQVSDKHYTFEDDVSATNSLFDKLQELCPGAEFHYMEGNHEHRIQKYCVTTAKKSGTAYPQKEAEALMRIYGPEHVLHLEKRGINYYQQGRQYMGLPLMAMIKLGKCHFVHGISTSQNAAKAHLDKVGGNVVYGHTHRMDSFHSRTIASGGIGAWSPGCGCMLQPLYLNQHFSTWQQGFGVQLVASDGSFLHINVPVSKGKSYLTLLTEKLN